jgi:hypothetical protein
LYSQYGGTNRNTQSTFMFESLLCVFLISRRRDMYLRHSICAWFKVLWYHPTFVGAKREREKVAKFGSMVGYHTTATIHPRSYVPRRTKGGSTTLKRLLQKEIFRRYSLHLILH